MPRLRATPSATAFVSPVSKKVRRRMCASASTVPGFRAHGIRDGNRTEQPAVARDKDLRCRIEPGRQGSRHRHVAFLHKRTVAHQDRRPADHRGYAPARCVIEPFWLKDGAALRPGVGHYRLAERVLGSHFCGGGGIEDRRG